MKKALKIIYLILLFAVFVFALGLLIGSIERFVFASDLYFGNLKTYGYVSPYIKEGYFYCLVNIIFYISVVAVLSFQIVIQSANITKNSNLINFTKYTYEEYKTIMDKKRAEKQEKKKQKLQQKLNEMEKGD